MRRHKLLDEWSCLCEDGLLLDRRQLAVALAVAWINANLEHDPVNLPIMDPPVSLTIVVSSVGMSGASIDEGLCRAIVNSLGDTAEKDRLLMDDVGFTNEEAVAGPAYQPAKELYACRDVCYALKQVPMVMLNHRIDVFVRDTGQQGWVLTCAALTCPCVVNGKSLLSNCHDKLEALWNIASCDSRRCCPWITTKK